MPDFNPDPKDAPYLEPATGDELVLVKQGRRHVFDCGPGEESALLGRLASLVADPTNNLNWFDAAILSHEVGQRMSRQLKLGQSRHTHKPAA